MKSFIGIMCFLSSLCSCSPITDELSEDKEDDLTYKLVWEGDTDKFTVDRKEGLRLNDRDKAAGSAFLATPSSQVRGMRWEFRTHLFFNPSAANYARFYLASSSKQLSGPLDGYFLQIGGAKDQVSLYRQEGLDIELLASGREVMKGNNSPELDVKVECDDNGYWTFWTCLKGEADYVEEDRVRDVTFTDSDYAGVLCIYTATRSNGFVFSHIRITDDVETTTDPEQPEQPEDPEQPEEPTNPENPEPPEVGALLFNEVMYHSAKDGAEYVELYNNSGKEISLSGLRLRKQNVNGGYIKGETLLYTAGGKYSKVPAGGYICFTKSSKTLVNKHKGKSAVLVSLTDFPALNNNGGFLVLLTKDDKVIDRCRFSDTMHTLPTKEAIGISLEKRTPGAASAKASNWVSSKNVTGGTPGVQNSVLGDS